MQSRRVAIVGGGPHVDAHPPLFPPTLALEWAIVFLLVVQTTLLVVDLLATSGG